jgi:hypothetical protein
MEPSVSAITTPGLTKGFGPIVAAAARMSNAQSS